MVEMVRAFTLLGTLPREQMLGVKEKLEIQDICVTLSIDVVSAQRRK